MLLRDQDCKPLLRQKGEHFGEVVVNYMIPQRRGGLIPYTRIRRLIEKTLLEHMSLHVRRAMETCSMYKTTDERNIPMVDECFRAMLR